MRRRLALFLLVGLVAFAAPAGASAAGRKARCAVKRSHTVAMNRLVRVYFVRRNGNRRLTGCLRATGRKHLVVREYDDGYVESGGFRDVRLAGRFLAVAFDATDLSCKAACPPDYETTQTSVVISDIRTRRDRTTRTHARTGSLRLSTAGVAAWLAPIESGFELHGYDGAGENVLDSGAIDPASVVLAGLQLTWANAGAARNAALTPF
ncbi:MAG: hypothetical protein ABI611_22340 [Solirubrobacteraceae bacterium]